MKDFIFFPNEFFWTTEKYTSSREVHILEQYLPLVLWVLKEIEAIQAFLILHWKKTIKQYVA